MLGVGDCEGVDVGCVGIASGLDDCEGVDVGCVGVVPGSGGCGGVDVGHEGVWDKPRTDPSRRRSSPSPRSWRIRQRTRPAA